FITGLWHGASWNFIFWGLFHGGFLILEKSRVFNTKNWPKLLQHLYVLTVVVVGWVFFRPETMAEAITYLKSMLGFTIGSNYSAFIYLNYYSILMLLLAVIFAMPIRNKANKVFNNIHNSLLRGSYDFGKYCFYMVLLIF